DYFSESLNQLELAFAWGKLADDSDCKLIVSDLQIAPRLIATVDDWMKTIEIDRVMDDRDRNAARERPQDYSAKADCNCVRNSKDVIARRKSRACNVAKPRVRTPACSASSIMGLSAGQTTMGSYRWRSMPLRIISSTRSAPLTNPVWL